MFLSIVPKIISYSFLPGLGSINAPLSHFSSSQSCLQLWEMTPTCVCGAVSSVTQTTRYCTVYCAGCGGDPRPPGAPPGYPAVPFAAQALCAPSTLVTAHWQSGSFHNAAPHWLPCTLLPGNSLCLSPAAANQIGSMAREGGGGWMFAAKRKAMQQTSVRPVHLKRMPSLTHVHRGTHHKQLRLCERT